MSEMVPAYHSPTAIDQWDGSNIAGDDLSSLFEAYRTGDLTVVGDAAQGRAMVFVLTDALPNHWDEDRVSCFLAMIESDLRS